MSVLNNVDLLALTQLIAQADNIRIKGTPRIDIELITWNGPEPYCILTAVGSTKDLRSVWNGTAWEFQTADQKRLSISSAAEYKSLTDAFAAIAEARTKHPNYKAPKEETINLDVDDSTFKMMILDQIGKESPEARVNIIKRLNELRKK